MPHDQLSSVGGAYAKLRGCDPACRELTGDDGVNRGRIHDAVAAFRARVVAYLQDRTIDGQPRTSRRYSSYGNCPLPTMADKLLFILTYFKQNPIQEVQGQLFGMSQSNANKWIHLLHAVLNHALADQELLPARTAEEFAAMSSQTDGREPHHPPFLA